MEIREMMIEDIEKRMSEIKEEMNAENADLDALTAEVDELEARKAELKNVAEQRKALEARVMAEGTIVKTFGEGENKMDIKELRNSEKYIDAYAEYVKTGKDEELRALLSENVSGGTIAVPDSVYDIVKTAWDNDGIMSLVTKTSIVGNLKVNFEISATGAIVHTEGASDVTEETLTEGIVTLTPAYINKWISISDEVMAMRGQAFLNYIYSELTHKITKKMADILVGKIVALPTTATATTPAAAQVKTAPAMGTVATAIGNLSDEAANPVIIMNKLTWSAFKTVQYANGYGVDPFEGLKVLFNNTLPAYSAASEGDVYMIVGDLGQGALANFPEGDAIKFTFDELTRKKEDLVEVLGKEFAAIGVVACGAFVNVTAPAQG